MSGSCPGPGVDPRAPNAGRATGNTNPRLGIATRAGVVSAGDRHPFASGIHYSIDAIDASVVGMAAFPLSDGPDAGAPGSRGLDCVQRPHNLFGNAEVLPHFLPTASREKAPFIAIRTVNAMTNIPSMADRRNWELS